MAKIQSTMVLTLGLFVVLLGTLAAQDRDRDEGAGLARAEQV